MMIFPFLAVAASQHSPPSGEGTAAIPKTPAQRLLSTDDIPPRMLRNGESLKIAVTLVIAPNGRASGCTVDISTGRPELDARACTIFQRRARYIPATDANGLAITGFHSFEMQLENEATMMGRYAVTR